MDDIDERLAAFSRLFAEQAGASAEAIEMRRTRAMCIGSSNCVTVWRGARACSAKRRWATLLAVSSKRWKQGSRHKTCQLQSTG